MTDYLICGGQLVTSGGTVPNSGILVTRGKIAAPGAPGPGGLYPGFCCSGGRTRGRTPSPDPERGGTSKNCCVGDQCSRECVEIDASGLMITPGFIDLHVHGGNGCDILDGTAASIKEIASFHAMGGTTSFLATVAPAPVVRLQKVLTAVSGLTMKFTGGAQLLGIHMEGPYINPLRAGAINPAFLKKVSISEMSDFISAGEGTLKMVTVAPELPGSPGLIEMLAGEGITVSVGHSEADYETAVASFKAGVSHAIHLFNASAPLHHREPGLVGAVLAERDITAEIIADGRHLHPAMLKMLYSIKGNRGLTLATDAVSAAGRPDGDYLFNGRRIISEKGKVTLPGGTMAGSSLTMVEAVKNMVSMAGIPLYEAIRMASLNPARLLGRENSKGALAPGMDADIVLLDSNFNVRLTMVCGEIVYSNLKTPQKKKAGS